MLQIIVFYAYFLFCQELQCITLPYTRAGCSVFQLPFSVSLLEIKQQQKHLLLHYCFFERQIPIKSRGSGRGQLEITYLDEELRLALAFQIFVKFTI